MKNNFFYKNLKHSTIINSIYISFIKTLYYHFIKILNEKKENFVGLRVNYRVYRSFNNYGLNEIKFKLILSGNFKMALKHIILKGLAIVSANQPITKPINSVEHHELNR